MDRVGMASAAVALPLNAYGFVGTAQSVKTAVNVADRASNILSLASGANDLRNGIHDGAVPVVKKATGAANPDSHEDCHSDPKTEYWKRNQSIQPIQSHLAEQFSR